MRKAANLENEGKKPGMPLGLEKGDIVERSVDPPGKEKVFG